MREEEAAALASFYAAIADPTRLVVVMALCEHGELHVTRLTQLAGRSRVLVSQHLMHLRAEGIVHARKAGRQVYYRLARPEVCDALRILYREVLRG